MLNFNSLLGAVATFALLSTPAMLAADMETISKRNGWKATADGDQIVLRKTVRGEQVVVRTWPWESRRGKSLETWIEGVEDTPSEGVEIQKVIGDAKMLDGAEFGIDGVAIVSRLVKDNRASIITACADRLQIRRFEMSWPIDLDSGLVTQEVHGSGLAKSICDDAPRALRDVQRPSGSPTFSKGSEPNGFRQLWYIGDFRPGVSGYQARQYAVVAFADKTVTRSPELAFASGADTARRGAADDWGVWRLKRGDLEIKWTGSDRYRDFYLTLPVEPAPSDMRIDGCYRSSKGYSIGFAAQTASFAVNSWCFERDGRFSNNTTVAIGGSVGNTTATGSGSDDAQGWYRIDGNTIQLKYDDGKEVTTSFGLMHHDAWDKDVDIMIGGGFYD